MDKEFSQVLKTYRVDQTIPSVTERYFTVKEYSQGDYPQCVLVHSNKLCIVTLSSNHPVIAEGKTVTSVNFETCGNVNRLKNKVSGRFKRGGQRLKEKSLLCTVHCSDGSDYTLLSCVSGILVEVNERLIEEPNLLTLKPWAEGYVAIILPPFTNKKDDKGENTTLLHTNCK